ncbi:MAG TPA: hypothetical protein IGS53_05750 [Leptolyngbyaceae cyanobacterium M33_DOE_097]|uniref:HlyD family efflux transporter periplasmic adaptor subunit n=1 Tax=Oscillatoriales cyanobacterium SpSt-418 TaxID=2282169 RepID=A0A7C3KCB1_9CYAN|nr:hypothetical protein [Leptolyngbyaceae cyanobacterium M33_DOE_097]
MAVSLPVNDSPQTAQSLKPQQRKRLIVLSGSVVGLLVGAFIWQQATRYETSQNAYVTAEIHPLKAHLVGSTIVVSQGDRAALNQAAIVLKLENHSPELMFQQTQAAITSAQYHLELAQLRYTQLTTEFPEAAKPQTPLPNTLHSLTQMSDRLTQLRSRVLLTHSLLTQAEADSVKANLDYQQFAGLESSTTSTETQAQKARVAYEATQLRRNELRTQMNQLQTDVAQLQKQLTTLINQLIVTRQQMPHALPPRSLTSPSQPTISKIVNAISESINQLENAKFQLLNTSNLILGQAPLAVVYQEPWVVAEFEQAQQMRIQSGQIVEIRLKSRPNETFSGKVLHHSVFSQKRNETTTKAQSGTDQMKEKYLVKIMIDSKDLRTRRDVFEPGEEASVKIKVW